ncbi:MAG: putative DNA-binding domain-containing protein [Rheinheimera sp.]|nr:putative DNA-binding domain-containing protein [Rheinheimera sp.]
MQEFQQQQLAFIRRIKDPTAPLPAGIRPERMAVYEELFFNNLQNFVCSAFPVLLSIIPAEHWQALCRQFFREQQLHSPYFLDISKAFLHWLPQVASELPGFALELAEYEWLELALATDVAVAAPGWQFEPDRVLMLAPLTRLCCYQYPVQQISASFQPDAVAAVPVFLLLYRDDADRVRFLQLNAWSAAFLQLLLAEPGQLISTYLDWLQPYVPQWDHLQLLAQAMPLLTDLAARGIVIAAAEK